MDLQRKKLVFLDIDGTLIPRSQKMSEKTIQALRQAHAGGHILCICTGRTYCEMPEEMKKFDGVICAAGACVMWKNKILLAQYFSDQEKKQVMNLLEEADAVYTMEGFDDLYMKKENYESFVKRLGGCSEEEREILKLFERTCFCAEVEKMEKVHKCSYFYAGKEDEWFRERLEKWGMGLATFSQGDARGNSGEITKNTFTKGSAVRLLSDYLEIPIEDTIAIGDSENDLAMLRTAGIGIAMGNAFDYVKEAADYVTASVDEDGVYHAFRKYGLIS